jgi:SPOR domain
MGPGLFRDEPGREREPVDQGAGGFRIDPADRPFATSEPERGADSWNLGDYSALRIGVTRVVVALVFMGLAAGGLWIAYSKGKSAISGGGVPLIKADQTAMKSKPDNPGGVSEEGDTPVYSVNAGNGAKVEQLLPGPEQPLTKPAPVAEVPPAVAASPAVPGAVASGANPSAAATAPTAASPASAPVTASGQNTLAPVAVPPGNAQPTVATAPQPVASTAPVAAPPAAPPGAPVEAPPVVAPPVATPKPAVSETPAKAPRQTASAGGGPLRIQIAATKDIASAHKEWARLKAAHMDVLGDLKAFGVRVDLGDRGIFYRIQAGPIDSRADAQKRCAVLKESGIGCIIVKQP